MVRQVEGVLDLSWVHKELAPYYSLHGRLLMFLGYQFLVPNVRPAS